MNNRHGFTLIEILIAMAVFLIGVVSIVAVFPAGLEQARQGQHDSVAATFIESFEAAVKGGIRNNTGDAIAPASRPNTISVPGTTGYYVRFYHDGADAAGGSVFRLPRDVDTDGNPDTMEPDYTQLGGQNDRVGWWWPDRVAAIDDPQGGVSLPDGILATNIDAINDGAEVVRMGSEIRTSRMPTPFHGIGLASVLFGPGNVGLELDDPLRHYYYNFRVEYHNRVTPTNNPGVNGDDPSIEGTQRELWESYISVDANPWASVTAPSNLYFPGLFRFTVFIYHDWNKAVTGWKHRGVDITKVAENREMLKVEVFQFLIFGTR